MSDMYGERFYYGVSGDHHEVMMGSFPKPGINKGCENPSVYSNIPTSWGFIDTHTHTNRSQKLLTKFYTSIDLCMRHSSSAQILHYASGHEGGRGFPSGYPAGKYTLLQDAMSKLNDVFHNLEGGSDCYIARVITLIDGEDYNPIYNCRNSDITLLQWKKELMLMKAMGPEPYLERARKIMMDAPRRMG